MAKGTNKTAPGISSLASVEQNISFSLVRISNPEQSKRRFDKGSLPITSTNNSVLSHDKIAYWEATAIIPARKEAQCWRNTPIWAAGRPAPFFVCFFPFFYKGSRLRWDSVALPCHRTLGKNASQLPARIRTSSWSPLTGQPASYILSINFQ